MGSSASKNAKTTNTTDDPSRRPSTWTDQVASWSTLYQTPRVLTKQDFVVTTTTTMSSDVVVPLSLAQLWLTHIPGLPELRYQVVPGVLAEDAFWARLYTILHSRWQEQRQEQQSNGSTTIILSNGHGHGSSTSTTDAEWRELLREKDQQIASLQAQLAVALQQQQQDKKPPKHSGKWVLSQDSQEFLEYPQELKDNLRQEKQKRLKQVHDDMKFILNSDEPQDAHGHWSCCGATEYHEECKRG